MHSRSSNRTRLRPILGSAADRVNEGWPSAAKGPQHLGREALVRLGGRRRVGAYAVDPTRDPA
jgi:hypothetical protein